MANEDNSQRNIAELHERLNSVQAQAEQRSNSLQEAMEALSEQIDRLATLFEKADKHLYDQYEKGLHKDGEKLDKVIEQNDRIAHSILSLADTIENTEYEEVPQQAYPLRGPEEMSSAPWEIPDDESMGPNERATRKSLMDAFK